MFFARDRKQFSQEIRNLAGRAAASAAADESAAMLQAANAALEKIIAPLFEAYAELVRGCGRSCEYKVMPGSFESHPRSSAVAEFLVDLQGVPGLAAHYLRLENDGGDWRVLSRPALEAKARRRDSGSFVLPASDLPGAIEGTLQHFIRAIF